jgi:hypothetical protein
MTAQPFKPPGKATSRRIGVIVLSWFALQCALTAAPAGRVVAWGPGQVLPSSAPTNIVAISSSADHSLALRADGTVFAWGDNMNGQCNVPAGLTGVTKVAAGEFFSVALRSNGSIVVWGANDYGQHDVPPGLTGVTDISAGHGHVLARKNTGTVVSWGCNIFNQTNVPAGLNRVRSILAVWNYSVAVRSNGTVVAWGLNDTGQTNVPATLAAVRTIAGNNNYCMALRSNGTVVAWGQYPALPSGLDNVTAIAAGETHALALTSAGNIIAWGDNQSGATTVPAGITAPFALAASWHYSAALGNGGTTVAVPQLSSPRWNGNNFSVTLTSQQGVSYILEYKNGLNDASWTQLSPVSGIGATLTLTDPSASGPRRFYRVRAD